MASYTIICDYCKKSFQTGRKDSVFCGPHHEMHCSRLRNGQLDPDRTRRSSPDMTAEERKRLDEDYLRRVHDGVQLGLPVP